MAGKSVGGFFSIGSGKLVDFVGHQDPLTHDVMYAWEPVGGARNVGLTARIWGTVTAAYHLPTGEQWFYVDDGSEVRSDLGDMGVLVYGDADVKQGQFVSVIGLVSVDQSFDSWYRLVRTIETSSAADVQVIRQAPVPERPFSDEFDNVLKPGWSIIPTPGTDPTHVPPTGSISLTLEPGWLALTAPASTASGATYSPMVVQLLQGDWTLDMKVRCAEPGPSSYGYVNVFLTGGPYVNPWQCGECGLYFARGAGQAIVSAGWYLFYNGPASGDVCYLRVRKNGSILLTSYSFDGVTYSIEKGGKVAGACLALCSEVYRNSSNQDTDAYTAYVDYVRFSAPE